MSALPGSKGRGAMSNAAIKDGAQSDEPSGYDGNRFAGSEDRQRWDGIAYHLPNNVRQFGDALYTFSAEA